MAILPAMEQTVLTIVATTATVILKSFLGLLSTRCLVAVINAGLNLQVLLPVPPSANPTSVHHHNWPMLLAPLPAIELSLAPKPPANSHLGNLEVILSKLLPAVS